MEHRWGQRLNVRLPVRLAIGQRAPHIGRLQNVSISGAFVHTRSPAPVGTLLELDLPLSDGAEERPQRTAAYVARTTADGIGIEWCELAPPLAIALLGASSIATSAPVATKHGPYPSETAAGRTLCARHNLPPRVSAA